MGKITQTISGVTVGNVAVFGNVNGDIVDGGPVPTEGTGTVTSVAVASAHGFSGTVATPTTHPTITLNATPVGILKSNGTTMSAATADTDYQAPISLTTTGSGAATFIADVLNIPTPAAASTTLTGEATGTGTGTVATTLTNSAVIAKVLTGFTSGAGTVSAADSILTAVQKINGNTALLTGAVVFQGTWNATSNTPTLTSGVGTKGFLYKVSVAGSTTLDGISQWNVGDSAVFDGTVWDKIDGLANEVISVAGRTGVVTLAVADVTNAVSTATTVNGHALSTNVVVSASDITTGNLPNAQLPTAITNPATALSIVSTSIATNAALANYFSVTLATGATTMSAPTNPADGQVMTYELRQPPSGGAGTVTWNAAFDFGAAATPTLSATNNLYDLVSFRYSSRNSKWNCLGSALGF